MFRATFAKVTVVIRCDEKLGVRHVALAFNLDLALT
jgi:hypothetical protein